MMAAMFDERPTGLTSFRTASVALQTLRRSSQRQEAAGRRTELEPLEGPHRSIRLSRVSRTKASGVSTEDARFQRRIVAEDSHICQSSIVTRLCVSDVSIYYLSC
jgi:hypothetical protein